MTVLSAQTIRRLGILHPCLERTVESGSTVSHGLSACGYDVRCDQWFELGPGDFMLLSTMERFVMPNDVVGIVHDKSTWARRGLAVQNTVIEPGWSGYLTLEVTNHGSETIQCWSGVGIAQIVFHRLDEPTETPYDGKYQNQERGPQRAR